MSTLDAVAVIAATEQYMKAEVKLRRKSRVVPPAEAQSFRRLASICHRAALAEARDDKPEGL